MFMMVKTSAARSVTNMLAASRGDETELDLSAVTGNGSLVRDLQWLNKLGTLHLALLVVTFFIFPDTNDNAMSSAYYCLRSRPIYLNVVS